MAKKEPKKKSENKEVGRPTEYRSEYCEMLINHMAEGLSFESFAGVVRHSRSSIYKWREEIPEFSDAVEVGFSLCRLWWEKLGIDNIINKSESFGEGVSASKSLNSTVYNFNMKNRFGWRDKQPDENEIVINNVNTLSDDELDAKIAEKMKGKA